MRETEEKIFHCKDGWYFGRRLTDGAVHIVKRSEPKSYSPIISETYMSPDDWASIVAFVSQWGESAQTFGIVRDFHGS